LLGKPDHDLTRSLDGVVHEESAEETDGDEDGDEEVVEEGDEEGIPATEEADMSNNQELEGDCILVKHVLEIADHAPLSSEVSMSRAGRR